MDAIKVEQNSDSETVSAVEGWIRIRSSKIRTGSLRTVICP